jgi:hypothetical protein
MYQATERWRALCEQAAAEQDGARLLEIINELDRALDEKSHRTRNQKDVPHIMPEVFKGLPS